MKFGAVPDSYLQALDISLPQEPAANAAVLSGVRTAQPKVYIGGARWGDAAWVGHIYPAKTPATRYRQLYPQHFNAIELNATHYTVYSAAILQQWAAAAKDKDFKFCPKFPQQISHYSNFKDVDAVTAVFLQSIAAFENQLGPIFLQMGENFTPVQKGALFHYLSALPKDKTFFVELRHPQWFEEKEKEVLFSTLRTLNIGAVITDAPGRRDVAHMHLTVPKLFLRFVCNGVHPTSFRRTDDWVKRIQHWIENGMEEVYVFLHPGDDAAIPPLAAYWINALNEACKLQLKPPVAAQAKLF